MTPVEVTLRDGRAVVFEVDDDAAPPAYFVLSLRKCGSSIFNKIVHHLAYLTEHHFLNVAPPFFENNIVEGDYVGDPGLNALLQPGNVIGGFRRMPTAFLNQPLFDEGLKVMMVRDPRDALVSNYYSDAYSHHVQYPIPEPGPMGDSVFRLMNAIRDKAQNTEINDWVLESAVGFNHDMVGLAPLLDDPKTIVFHYERYIFDKGQMMREIARHFGWRIEDKAIRRILRWADVRPDREDTHAFIRQVTPGNHRSKLGPDTIEELDEILEPSLQLFGYTDDL